MASWLQRYIVDPVSAGLAYAVYFAVRVMPLDMASAVGSRIARTIGPMLPVHKIARKNITAAFPEKTETEVNSILNGMWDNIGRTFFEYPHLSDLLKKGRVEFVGNEHIESLRDDGIPGLIWGAHLGNWELVPASSGHCGMALHRIYRKPNNPHIDWLFRAHRDFVQGELLPKGSAGARRTIKNLKEGGHLGMLVDQKMNDGIAVPFFGRPAMTAPALATFAFRFKCPLVSVRVLRLGGAHFRVEMSPPYTFEDTGDREADVLTAMTSVNRCIEDWIRAYPEQWFWVHRRWPKTEVPPQG
jgi:KDO2-lipid IV(A) lauroyltransferase